MQLTLPFRFVVLALLVAMTAAPALSQQPLAIPEIVSGSVVDLTLQEGTREFFPGFITQTMGANGDFLGPTLVLDRGQEITLNVHNQLSEMTTVHWHGLHVAPENDGGPHTTIMPGATWSPSFTVLDHASTYWYHPHAHHMTDRHVSLGIAGLIIVRDEEEAALDLPRTYGVDDIPVIIQTRQFDEEGQIVVHAPTDDVLMINGTMDPYVSVPAQVVRLRLLNGSSMRTFNVGLSENRSFHMIASDGGLLEAPVSMTRLQLNPGERAEILVDLTGQQGQTIHLKSYASELPNGIYGATFPGMGMGMTLDGYNPNPLNGADFDILRMDIVAPAPDPVIHLPEHLVEVTPWDAAAADTLRTFIFNPTVGGPDQLNHPFTINNAPFDMNVINEVIPVDNLEIWQVTNNTGIAHPFHVHMVQFYILSRNGAVPPAHERGRKDVVMIAPMETVRIIARFETFYNEEIPYMYHCHMLIHEDHDMMGQFLVVPRKTQSEPEPTAAVSLSLGSHPNPFSQRVSFSYELPTDEHVVLKIFGLQGQLVATVVDGFSTQGRHSTTFDASGLASGVYLAQLTAGTQRVTHTLTVVR